jgi:sulfite exporter TauE/SafE
VGVAHGLAGTAPLVALLPLALGGSPLRAGAYLLFFGVGTVAAMGFYALVAGVVFDRASARSLSLARGMRLVTALASTAIGVLWMHGAVAGGA